jgi:Mg2+ and Co2+ transporter CorA
VAGQSRIDLASVGPGVAWAFEFDETEIGRALPADEPIDLDCAGRFVWVHLILANARTRDWIRSQDCMPDDAKELFLSPEGHPRIDWSRDALWGVTFDAQRDLGTVSDEPTDLRFVVRPQFLVTGRHHPLMSASAVKGRVEQGATFASSVSLFERVLVTAADWVGAAAHRLSQDIDGIEDRVLSETLSDETAKLLKIRRSISRQERLISGAIAVLGQLEQQRGEGALEAYREMGRRVRQRVVAFHSDLHLQAERARLLQEETAAQLATATNKNLFILTVVTTLLLPPSLVTGYFGMNTKNLLFADSDNGTLYATGLVVLAASLVFLLIRRFRAPG